MAGYFNQQQNVTVGRPPAQERFNIRSMTAEEFRKKVLDPYTGNLQLIAMDHPEVIEQLAEQYELDQKTLGKIPTFITINTTEGLLNTTIRYSDFTRFYPLFRQRPDLIDSKAAANLAKRSTIPLTLNSTYAKSVMGEVPDGRR